MTFLAGTLAGLGLAAIALAVASLIARRRFRARPSVFACRVRTPTRGRRHWRRWPRSRTRARWISDVLVVRSGPLGMSSVPYAARIAAGTRLRRVTPTGTRRLRATPWALLLSTDEGPLEVAVAETDKELLVGPYLTAALTGLPSAPREGRS